MDVLVKWDDGTVNCVNTRCLKTIKKRGKYKIGARVKMFFDEKWYFGSITMVENTANVLTTEDQSDSSDNEPLSKKIVLQPNYKQVSSSSSISVHQNNNILIGPFNREPILTELLPLIPDNFGVENNCEINLSKVISKIPDENNLPTTSHHENKEKDKQKSEDSNMSDSYDVREPYSDIDLNDREDPTYHIQSCEVPRCKQEVFSSCHLCKILLCWDHFQEELPNCVSHLHLDSDEDVIRKRPIQKTPVNKIIKIPEDFFVEGSPKEYQEVKQPRKNKRKIAKVLKNSGKEYVSVKTKKTIPERKLGPACNAEWCKKGGRECRKFSEEIRQAIFSDFYNLADLQLQREFIVRFVEQTPKKSNTKPDDNSRRTYTKTFFLPCNGERSKVCRKMFINTLDIGEKRLRNTVKKNQSTGVVEKDKRGGRDKISALKDKALRDTITSHINKFPRVESHYCRKDSSREYLHGDLTLRKMYGMFLNELPVTKSKPSFSLYRVIFKKMNLSFHKPKKDQCGVCRVFHEGSEEEKTKIKDIYDKHIVEKEAVRKLKDNFKSAAKNDPKMFCACFDLQQVISLPISNDNAIFYKRRLSVFNFTIYDLANRDCYCLTWDECSSGRGSSEIATAVIMILKKYDEEKYVSSAQLFSDGCGGQNKNSIMATALLYTVLQSKHLAEISLRFFSPNHGQSEGDSAHSAITHAIKKAGDLFTPSQLVPVFRLARQNNTYKVYQLNYDDFLDYKKLSEDLRIKSIKKDDAGNEFKWSDIFEFFVKKENPDKIFFKTSHVDKQYRSMSLKRENKLHFLTIKKLNKKQRSISMLKYENLISLCSGLKPVISSPENKLFYRSLPHSQN
ncbi:unnamed protein product [Brassicogethes aeneus]|uniref:Uncharacterized protein n=1 Tax=Brassicogethes aeneus TaxID=1431903 RepID=A0A9P0AXF7_BRAAE|nr:unnamed protein product [Brassicogethes aeneus]